MTLPGHLMSTGRFDRISFDLIFPTKGAILQLAGAAGAGRGGCQVPQEPRRVQGQDGGHGRGQAEASRQVRQDFRLSGKKISEKHSCEQTGGQY